MVYSTTLTSQFASTYGSGSYNGSTYNGAAVSTGTAPSTTATGTVADPVASDAGGVLVNTGFAVILAISLACLIIFAALLVRFWKRPHSAQPE